MFGVSSGAASPSRLVDPTFLFRFQLTLRRHGCEFGSSGVDLDETYRVPSFSSLAGTLPFADVRLAFSESALAFSIEVTGKRSEPWCRPSRAEDSDGFHLWVDTRCSPGIHRATRYCHRFISLPQGNPRDPQRPVAGLLPIHRARQDPKPAPAGSVRVFADVGASGYRMSGRIDQSALTGMDVRQFPRLGIFFAVTDRELGWQALSLDPSYPVAEDPSLWGEAVLPVENSAN